VTVFSSEDQGTKSLKVKNLWKVMHIFCVNVYLWLTVHRAYPLKLEPADGTALVM